MKHLAKIGLSALLILFIVLTFAMLKAQVGTAPDGVIEATWDRYDTSTPPNDKAIYLKLYNMYDSLTPASVAVDSIPITDTSVTFLWPSDGKTYLFSIKAFSADTSSAFSNISSVTMEDLRIPGSVKNFLVRIIG